MVYATGHEAAFYFGNPSYLYLWQSFSSQQFYLIGYALYVVVTSLIISALLAGGSSHQGINPA